MGFSKNRIRYLIKKKNKIQTKKKYKKNNKQNKQKKNSFRKKKKNIRKSSIKIKDNKRKNIAKKKRKVYIIKGGGFRNLNPYDKMIQDILKNVFNMNDDDQKKIYDNFNDKKYSGNPSIEEKNYYNFNFLFDKSSTSKYIDFKTLKKEFEDNIKNKQEDENKDDADDDVKKRKPAMEATNYEITEMECKKNETALVTNGKTTNIFKTTNCSNDVFENIQNKLIMITSSI